MKLFLLLSPFTYLTQIFTGRNEVAVPVYGLLAVAAVRLPVAARRVRSGRTMGSLDYLVLVIAYLAFVWAGITFLHDGMVEGVRTFCLFALPPLIYFLIPVTASDRDVRRIVSILAVTATIVAVEQLYERYSLQILGRATEIQVRSFNYSQAVDDLARYQLIGRQYRPPGLLEHVHATAAYIAMGLFAWLSLYLDRRRRLYAIAVWFSAAALILSGVRLVMLASFVTLLYVHKLRRRIGTLHVAFSAAAIGSVLTLVVWRSGSSALSVLLDYYGRASSSQQLANVGGYVTAVLGFDGLQVARAFARYPHATLVGFGPTPFLIEVRALSDDLFVLALIAQYGLLGTPVFYGMFVVAIQIWRRSLRLLTARHAVWRDLGVSVVLLLLASTLHSGSIQRKAIYPMLFVGLALVRLEEPNDTDTEHEPVPVRAAAV